MFPRTPHLGCFVSHSLHISLTVVLLVPVAVAGPIKLPLIIASAAKHLTSHFTKLPQVHYWKLCMFIPIFPLLKFCRGVGKAVLSPTTNHHGPFLDLALHVISHAVPGRCAVLGIGCGPWWAWMLRGMLLVGMQHHGPSMMTSQPCDVT